MNQDFTVKKSNICLKKKFVQGASTEKKIPAQVVREKKNSYHLKIPHPPITFLMVRPLVFCTLKYRLLDFVVCFLLQFNFQEI